MFPNEIFCMKLKQNWTTPRQLIIKAQKEIESMKNSNGLVNSDFSLIIIILRIS